MADVLHKVMVYQAPGRCTAPDHRGTLRRTWLKLVPSKMPRHRTLSTRPWTLGRKPQPHRRKNYHYSVLNSTMRTAGR